MKRLVIIVVAACSACALHSAAMAQSGGERESVEVRIASRYVDFQNPRSVADFDQRLGRTAKAACDSGVSYNLGIQMGDAACARAAWERAVKSLNQPMLSALHNQTTALAQASTTDRK